MSTIFINFKEILSEEVLKGTGFLLTRHQSCLNIQSDKDKRVVVKTEKRGRQKNKNH